MEGNPSAARFPSTCWSRVVAAGDRASPEAGESLASLCAAYWYPLYAFIRRNGRRPDDAADLTQGYFARLIERGAVAAADPMKGRFRSFLLADCKHFLADQRERERAVKRGGGAAILSIDPRDAEGRFLREPPDDRTPERLFARAWALALLDGVLARLRLEYESTGRARAFEVLKAVLAGDPRATPRAEMARLLGTTEGAVQAAIHRLRKRYRDLLRGAIAETVDDARDIEDEIRDLFAALAD